VERIIAAGKARWPGKPDGEVLINLAEEAAGGPPRSSLIMRVPTREGRTITSDMIEDVLDD
jgi:hypothetical protein